MRGTVPLGDFGTVLCSVRSQSDSDNAVDAEHGSSAASQGVRAINGKALGSVGTGLAAFGIALQSPLQKPSCKTVPRVLF